MTSVHIIKPVRASQVEDVVEQFTILLTIFQQIGLKFHAVFIPKTGWWVYVRDISAEDKVFFIPMTDWHPVGIEQSDTSLSRPDQQGNLIVKILGSFGMRASSDRFGTIKIESYTDLTLSQTTTVVIALGTNYRLSRR